MAKNKHHCRLGINEIKSCFTPLHPKRNFSDVLFRKLRQYIILDLNDKKCKSFFFNNKAARSEFKRHLNSPHRFIIHPFSKANAFMEVLFVILLLCKYTLVVVLYGRLFIQLEATVNVLWLFVILSSFFTGYVKYDTKEICIHPKAIALHYIKTYFIFDVFLMVKNPLRLCMNSWAFHTMILILAIFSYLVRFSSMLSSLSNILLYFGLSKFKSFFIYEILKLMFFLHLITCFFIVLPDQIDPEFSKRWMYENAISRSRYEVYCNNFLIVACYFFGADYETDLAEPIENVALFLLSFVGRLYTLDLIARVLGLFGITNITDSKYEQQLNALWNYVNSLQIPEELRQRIVTSYQTLSTKQHFDEEEITSNLTDNLKTELFLYGVRSFIKKHAVLSKIPVPDLLKLFTIMESKLYLSKDVIVSAGDELKHAYFISSGTVAGYDVEGNEFIHLKDGDLFAIAWVAFREIKTTLMTWVALEATEVYCVTREDLTRYLNDQKDVANYFEGKSKEFFRKYEYYGTVGKWRKRQGGVETLLRKGEILEKQRPRLFQTD